MEELEQAIANTSSVKHMHQTFKIAISGAAETGHCGPNALELAKELGRQVATHRAVLITGATTGFPLWSCMGAKEAGGLSIGLSPAATEKEHIETYNLPIDYQDLILYTGFGYSGRNLLMTRSSDGVLIGCGRIGTIDEFTIAYEDHKPIGVLESDGWKTDEVLTFMLDNAHRPTDTVIFDKDPKALVERVIEMIRKEKQQYNRVYDNHDGWSGQSGDRVL